MIWRGIAPATQPFTEISPTGNPVPQLPGPLPPPPPPQFHLHRTRAHHKLALPGRRGGIGRRDGFKIRYPRGCVGSSPTAGIASKKQGDAPHSRGWQTPPTLQSHPLASKPVSRRRVRKHPCSVLDAEKDLHSGRFGRNFPRPPDAACGFPVLHSGRGSAW